MNREKGLVIYNADFKRTPPGSYTKSNYFDDWIPLRLMVPGKDGKGPRVGIDEEG